MFQFRKAGMILKAVFRIRKSFLLIRIQRSDILNYGSGSGKPKLRIQIRLAKTTDPDPDPTLTNFVTIKSSMWSNRKHIIKIDKIFNFFWNFFLSMIK
jgi:hypothetical protein